MIRAQKENKEALLEVEDLVVAFDTEQGRICAVDGVELELAKGSVLGIAGESGCGKSVTALSIMRLLPKPVSRIMGGRIWFKDQNLLDLPIEQMHTIRGKKISMIFQEPMTALNPVHSVGHQIMEVFHLHFPQMGSQKIRIAGKEMLEKVGIPDPDKVMKKFPHQLSGGMRQRVMIAMALACEPDILIADEPTTALDVTVQAQILDLIKKVQSDSAMSVILITHDLGVIAENCDKVLVMYAGRVAEKADVGPLFQNPLHPYTRGLLDSIPSRAKKAKTLLPTITGGVPSLLNMPDGCRFAGRCPHAMSLCRRGVPEMIQHESGHGVACHLYAKAL
ncbi:ABC transporter ATP-binding protein [Desulfospira joergensenii]|uniref:ABC transporter ATP-binding protein n=1 Tax=Desulfospira joergensenii TaxID=53329 RepID=UPI0003B70F8F|nr:ABC transporter ATP-binding protein [Desulfospira joergensenii]